MKEAQAWLDCLKISIEKEKKMRAFKGFNKDMTCRDFQYEEGKEFHTDKAKCCNEGFHACEYPLDCFGYYNPSGSVFHEVELSGDIDKSNGDSKVCSTDIKIGAQLSIAGLVKAAIEFTMSKVNKEADSDGNYGTSSDTGNCGASSATGDYGTSSATGYCGASSATGYRGASSVSDPTGVAVAWGQESKAKGCLGAHLILSDWKYTGEYYVDGIYKTPYDVDSWKLIGAKMVRVDGDEIKVDTYYRCIDGEIVEVE